MESYGIPAGGPSLLEVGNYLRTAATTRWLFPEELLVLLSYSPYEFGLILNHAAPSDPQSGQLFLFGDSLNCKQDGVSWAKKKSQDRIQETYMNIKISGVELVRGTYCKGADNPNFRRRMYRLMKNEGSSLCITHYRDCPDDEKPERPQLTPQIIFLLNQCFSRHTNPPSSTFPMSQLPVVTSTSMQQLNSSFQHEVMEEGEDFPNMLDWFEEDKQCTKVNPNIIDLAPDIVYQDGTNPNKVLLCTDVPLMDMQYNLLLRSGTQQYLLPCQKINNLTLRCFLPMLPSMQYEVYLADHVGMVEVQVSARIQILPLITTVPPMLINTDTSIPSLEKQLSSNNTNNSNSSKLGKRQFSGSSQSRPFPDSNDFNPYESYNIMETEHPAVNVASTSPLVTPSTLAIETNSIMSSSGNGKRSFNGQQSQHGHNDVDREYKIRIVEKLGYMKSALLHDENSSGPNSLGMSSEHHHLGLRSPFIRNSEGMMVDDDDTMKWLEEHELSNLSNVELEQIMDQNIEVVMQQLVQLAVLDEEMKAEIDALDSNGYSLLHYCCMYNLGSLIPVLVSKGAAVNKVTLSGDTPLHLALKGNHIDIIPALLEHGADVYQVLNGDNWTAFDLANMRNQSQALELFAKIVPRTPVANNYWTSPTRSDAASPSDQHLMSPEPHVTELPGTNPHNNSTASIDMSTKMMHEVFASLSLTDKCALSLTLDNTTSAIHNTPRSFNIDNAESSLLLDRIDPEVHTTYSNSIYEGYDNDEDMSEIHSVFSASDKESLVKAMSMMADQELQQVEDEVKKIQHNVRGWILRKNYNNLREAARVLQLAWREKKRSNTSHVDMINNISNNFAMMHDNVSDGIRSASSTVPNSRKSSFVDTLPNILDEFDINHPVNTYATKEERAAAKLQAATRRMIAKKSISSITKQTVASLVIQKHLVRWWLHAKYVQEDSNTSAATASSSASEEVPVRRPTTSSSSFSFSSSSSSIGMMASPPNK